MYSEVVLMNAIVFGNTSNYQSKCLARRKVALINAKSCMCKFCMWRLPLALLLRGLPWASQEYVRAWPLVLDGEVAQHDVIATARGELV
eukprot:2075187-Pyramimonas_sp.AAC.1